MNAIAKPPFTQSIVQVNANETIPPALLMKLLTENRSYLGFVVREAGSMVVERFDDIEDEPVEKHFKEFTGILENTKKFSRMFIFGQCPEEFETAEVQPWTIIKDSKGSPMVVVAIDGDFPQHVGDGKTSEAFNYVNDYLGPKIEEMYALFGNDPSKLDTYLRGPAFGKDLALTYGHRAVFEFMPLVGLPFTQGKNEIGCEVTWGRASNVYGYTESVMEAATPIAPAEPSKRSKYSDDPAPAITPAPSTAPAVPKPEIPVPMNNPAPVKDPVAAAADKTVNGHWEDIPTNMHGKRRKKWIRDITGGDLPPNHENLKKVWVQHEATAKSLADLLKIGVTATGAKDMKTDVHPVISGAQQAAANEFIKQYLDDSSNRIQHPLDAQKEEARFPVFSELMKKSMPTGLDDIETWPVTALKAFLLTHPELSLLMTIEYRRDRTNRKQSAAMGDKKLGELTGTIAPVSQSPTGTTTSTAAPEPAKRTSKYA